MARVEISHRTLCIVIQSLAADIRKLGDALDKDPDANPEDYRTLEDWERAAEDLETAYNAASRQVLNLPDYDSLIGA